MLANFHQPFHRLHVLVGRLEDVAGARRRLRLPGHRAHQSRHVAAHPEALVPDPVGLHEILPTATAGEGQGTQQHREAEFLVRDPRLR